jgi:hypothetical protein
MAESDNASRNRPTSQRQSYSREEYNQESGICRGLLRIFKVRKQKNPSWLGRDSSSYDVRIGHEDFAVEGVAEVEVLLSADHISRPQKLDVVRCCSFKLD